MGVPVLAKPQPQSRWCLPLVVVVKAFSLAAEGGKIDFVF